MREVGETRRDDRVLMVDPWGVNNLYYYTNGLCEALGRALDLTLVTNVEYPVASDRSYRVIRIFFPFSERMGRNRARRIVRGIEYLVAMISVIGLVVRQDFRTVHIQWALFYPIDRALVWTLRKLGRRTVYTAHNAVPHVRRKGLRHLERIYNQVDSLIVHGPEIEAEIRSHFPTVRRSIVIQAHGSYEGLATRYDLGELPKRLVDKVSTYQRLTLFVGSVHPGKGVDRLFTIWKNDESLRHALLVVAGRRSGEAYPALDRELVGLEAHPNIVYLDEYIPDEVLAFLLDRCSLVALPYRHASMSGVVFTAAAFARPVLVTRVGALPAYVPDDSVGYVVNDDIEDIRKALRHAMVSSPLSELRSRGAALKNHLDSHYSWNTIAARLLADAYGGEVGTL